MMQENVEAVRRPHEYTNQHGEPDRPHYLFVP